ncbi:MAG: orotate phosphoribosyltransferase [Eubacteriales bacterium]|nr:orotate phosphoribosyltransferase [Eubacteriales bacterium]
MQQPIRIVSRVNSKLYADAIPGHFATNHSHINYYIDMSEIKHSMSMSLEAARSIAFHFASVSVDTIMCLEGTEYIGAYLARELSGSSISGMNSGNEVYLVEPENNVNGQFMFADNLRPMIEHRNVLVLVNTASTGQTLAQTRECVEYYGGRVAGYSALFSNISELDGKPVVSLFSGADFPHYHNFVRGKDCPACAAGTPLDAIVTPRGYTKL